jgi:Icc-related predicted phosphoesterase
MIRLAAIGDVHFAEDNRGKLRPRWERLAEEADVFLLCGDLTNLGDGRQSKALADELRGLPLPMIAVLGNHDYHAGDPDGVRRSLEGVGVCVLDGEHTVLEIGGTTLGVAGVKGFGGGFAGACGHMFGEIEMKAFMQVTEREANLLEENLRALHTDYRVAMLHYAPVKETLAGERLEIFPFLGSYRLAEALDAAGCDLAIHGHAHHGSEKGITARGIPVRNVAMPLIRRPYVVYDLDPTIVRHRERPAGTPEIRLSTPSVTGGLS